MTADRASAHEAWVIPPRALTQWLALAATLEEYPDVPCRTEDLATWWPDKRDADAPATHGAVAGCRRCPAEAECLAYALAADERFGVWGGTLPEERRVERRLTTPR